MRTNNSLVRLAVLQALAWRIGAGSSHTRQGERRSGAIRHCRRTAPQRAQNFATQAKMQLLYRYESSAMRHKPGDRGSRSSCR